MYINNDGTAFYYDPNGGEAGFKYSYEKPNDYKPQIVKIADNTSEINVYNDLGHLNLLALTNDNDLYLMVASSSSVLSNESIPMRIGTSVRSITNESIRATASGIYYITNNNELHFYSIVKAENIFIDYNINTINSKYVIFNNKKMWIINSKSDASRMETVIPVADDILKYYFTTLTDLVVDNDNNLRELHRNSSGIYRLGPTIINDISDVIQFGRSALFLKSNGEIWGANYSGRENRFETPFLTAYGQKPLKILFNDNEIKLTLKVHVVNGRTMYPFRECLEAMGAVVSWDAVASAAIGELNGIKIEFPIGSNEYYINGVKKEMDAVSYVDEGINRTYIPLRFAAEGLGFKVDWFDNPTEELITINK